MTVRTALAVAFALLMAGGIAPAAHAASATDAAHAASAAHAANLAGVAAFLRDRRIARYTVALADLNRDGRAEALIYAMGTSADGGDLCGSGGCNLYVLLLTAKKYRQVGRTTVTRPPIRMLPTVTHGWHDIGVRVAGGGLRPGHDVRLRFNGTRYPSNPTTRPATGPATREHGTVGTVLIATMPPARAAR